MEYKLIALDMDGTLLTSKKTITARCARTIAAAYQAGKIVTISTGRPIQGLSAYERYIEPDIPVITYNGAMLIRLHSKEILYHKQMDTETAREILSFGRRFDTTMVIWSDNKLYVNRINDAVKSYKLISGVEPILLEEEEAVLKAGITKMLWLDDAEKHLVYQDILDRELQHRKAVYCTSQPTFLEFMGEGISKAAAMEQLSIRFDIRREEMIAVGDGYNDLAMIEYAGLGVAMANAPEEVREKADYVTAGNDENGVALVIEKFMM